MTEKQILSEALNEIASQIEDWLTWNKDNRAAEGLTTEDGTHLTVVPSRCWPHHGQLQNWITALRRAGQHLGE